VLLLGRMNLDRIPFGIVCRHGGHQGRRRHQLCTSFDVHAACGVRLLDRDQDWVRVRLANGLEGWLRAEDVGRL